VEIFSGSIWPVAALACTFILVLVLWVRNSGNNKFARMVYQKKINLFTEDDQRFYRTLQEAIGNDYIVLSKIRIADIISPKRGAAGHGTLAAFTSLATQCFDFILLEPKNFTIACVILAQDQIDATKQDQLLTICEAVALPMACFTIDKECAAWQIRDRLLPLLQGDTPLTFTESDGRIEPHISNLEDIQL
jgi:hypothetical protein